MTAAEARLLHRMDVPAFMTLFHAGFLILSLISLFLIEVHVIPFDFDAALAVAVACLLNVTFAFLWAAQASKRTPQKPILQAPSSPLKTARVSSMVSFVIVAHDDEQTIAHCIDSVFKTAVECGGPGEVIVVDDGSSDNTYDTAWASLMSRKQQLTNVPVKVVRHTAHLGLAESVRTAVNRALGEDILLIDAKTVCDRVQMIRILDRVYSSPKNVADIQCDGGLYGAEGLRRLLF